MTQLWVELATCPKKDTERSHRLTEGIENLIQVLHAGTCLDEGLDALVAAADGARNLVNILRLDDGLEVILEQLGEVVWTVSGTVAKGRVVANSLWSSEPRKCLMTSSQSGGLSNLPRLGLSLPLRILRAVLLPIPLVPTRPRTLPGLGMGKRWSLKLLAE